MNNTQDLKKMLDELDFKYGYLDIQKPYYYNQDYVEAQNQKEASQ